MSLEEFLESCRATQLLAELDADEDEMPDTDTGDGLDDDEDVDDDDDEDDEGMVTIKFQSELPTFVE